MLAISTVATAQSPSRVAALEWMTGTWVHETPEGRTTETWLGPGNGLMVAANLATWKSGRKFFEFLRIGDTPDGFSYYASPGGKPVTEFKLKTLGDRKVVFENPQHDFPQRILYWRDGEALVARIEGTAGGKEKGEEWRFVRQK
ncbi:hypothetical protein BWI17_04155 [Betaproteobacteria bacterium GR16-43]|nr:hypothetical protein BWI17_04155 [Betaproteobacteria bacterium GR16-43]